MKQELPARRRGSGPAPRALQTAIEDMIRTKGLAEAARLTGLGDDTLMRLALGVDVTPVSVTLATLRVMPGAATPTDVPRADARIEERHRGRRS